MATGYDLSLSVVMRIGVKPCFFSSFRSNFRADRAQRRALDQEVEHLAFVIDRPPQPVFSATDLDDHLVEMPT